MRDVCEKLSIHLLLLRPYTCVFLQLEVRFWILTAAKEKPV
jgi:hypothetical protein